VEEQDHLQVLLFQEQLEIHLLLVPLKGILEEVTIMELILTEQLAVEVEQEQLELMALTLALQDVVELVLL
tara:strand:+ start:44 stop:256 length:213 start_codon:yes stop_codon:yes gene_type:complete